MSVKFVIVPIVLYWESIYFGGFRAVCFVYLECMGSINGVRNEIQLDKQKAKNGWCEKMRMSVYENCMQKYLAWNCFMALKFIFVVALSSSCLFLSLCASYSHTYANLSGWIVERLCFFFSPVFCYCFAFCCAAIGTCVRRCDPHMVAITLSVWIFSSFLGCLAEISCKTLLDTSQNGTNIDEC